MITEIKGDLVKMALNGEFDVIGHGCNLRGNMGAGIALQIARAFPEAAASDISMYKTGSLDLGDIDCTTTNIDGPSKQLVVANCYTQRELGRFRNQWSLDSYADRLGAIKDTMTKLCEQEKDSRIGIPYIGAGLAGLRWEDVRSVLNEVVPSDVDFVIVEYDSK